MGASTVTPFYAFAPVPDLTVLELAIVICFVRRPGCDVASVGDEIGRWFKTSIVESDLSNSLRRLVHREFLTTDGKSLFATEEAREKAESAARGIVHLTFRDRYFFDVGKLLDVSIREDKGHAI